MRTIGSRTGHLWDVTSDSRGQTQCRTRSGHSRNNGVKKKKSYKRGSKRRATGSITGTALRCFGIGVCLFFLCSCLGFDIGDWPSRYQAPHNNPAANWCGPAGAFCAYFLLYYIGPGVFVMLASASYFLGARLANKQSSQPVLRMIGLALVTAAVSMSFQCLWPEQFYGFQAGSGGVLGAGLTQLLRGHFASLGTFILLSAIWIVGVILLADALRKPRSQSGLI